MQEQISFTRVVRGMLIMVKKIGQGRENAKKYLEEHLEITEAVEHGVRVHYGLIEDDTKPEVETEETSAKTKADK